jgi:hypothetical protein
MNIANAVAELDATALTAPGTLGVGVQRPARCTDVAG